MFASAKRALIRDDAKARPPKFRTDLAPETLLVRLHHSNQNAAPLEALSDDMLPLQRAYRWEKERASHTFLTQPLRGQVRDWTWAQAMDEVRRIAAFLAAQNWPAGSRIVILSKNCSWWMMAELAIWMAGHVTVPIYPSLSAQTIRTLLEHCEPTACFIGTVEDKTVMTEAIPANVLRISFPSAVEPAEKTWDSVVTSTAPLASSPVRAQDELSTIIYTSGTTGAPKGAMHRFAAFSYFVLAAIRVYGADREERMLSYLPLAHIAERALVESVALFCGYHVFFVENINTFREDIKRARPTIFFSVPRLYMKFQQGVLAKIPEKKLKRLLAMPLVRTIVRKKILRELGLDSVRMAASGGAALPLDTLKWYRTIGLDLVEGYGMTETGITHTPRGGRSYPGYVGDSVPGVETKISETGEVLVRSPMNMIGYYKDPEGTKLAFTEDGFFRTGDLGEIDADGWLKIIGRVKEQFKTSKGKYVSPAVLEKLLSVDPAIEASCVMGAGMPSPFAIVLLTQEARDSLRTPGARQACERDLQMLLERVNSQVDHHEQLEFLVVTSESWTIANGVLTPTMKLKRSIVEQRYSSYFAAWLKQGKRIIWHDAASTTA